MQLQQLDMAHCTSAFLSTLTFFSSTAETLLQLLLSLSPPTCTQHREPFTKSLSKTHFCGKYNFTEVGVDNGE